MERLALSDRLKAAGGVRLDEDGRRILAELAGSDRLIELMSNWALIGVTLSISEADDPSDLGVEMQWMSAEQMVDEAFQAYPGIVAIDLDYLPVGMCLEGSGDPYFYRVADGAIVRIPHDAVRGDTLDESAIELIAPSVDALLAIANLSAR